MFCEYEVQWYFVGKMMCFFDQVVCIVFICFVQGRKIYILVLFKCWCIYDKFFWCVCQLFYLDGEIVEFVCYFYIVMCVEDVVNQGGFCLWYVDDKYWLVCVMFVRMN